ncbi:unnamed protein product [Clonostachys chloroleuca]|uniref:Carboxylic ester hydrolase n=1 Tax=Clonostachys chloroleuca TaxID=1926264 RepID=A0AA35VLD2_9HYPO|nr:unnamed protein product [Clonostachys chloroleuca]
MKHFGDMFSLLAPLLLVMCPAVGAISIAQDSPGLGARSCSQAEAQGNASTCYPEYIKINPIFGLQIISIEATAIFNATTPPNFQNSFPASANITGINYCNVTVTSRHPSYQEAGIKTSVYLPLNNWNERMMGIGGSGFSAGNQLDRVLTPLSQGFATVSTSAGVSRYTMQDQDRAEVANSDFWALRSPGNSVIENFYKKPAKFRYWNGCSTGGRQALMLAQRYPKAYHGLLGGCPAINWARFLSADLFPQIIMKNITNGGRVPAPCEFRAITAAALEACDSLDGVKDGYVMDPSKCEFKAATVLGKQISCPELPGGNTTVSGAAVKAAEVAWVGYHTVDGVWRYYGVSRTTNITTAGTLLDTKCDNTGNCTFSPFPIAANWVKNFLMKDLQADPMSLTHSQFDRLWQLSVQEWSSFMSTDDPDLAAFRDTGGKLMTWHGLDDIQIQAGGTEEYYKRVLAVDSKAADYFRFFQVPGVGHCSGGFGAYPGTSFQSLMDWVEKGIAPETLYGRTSAGAERPICLYPKKVSYVGENVGKPHDLSNSGLYYVRPWVKGTELTSKDFERNRLPSQTTYFAMLENGSAVILAGASVAPYPQGRLVTSTAKTHTLFISGVTSRRSDGSLGGVKTASDGTVTLNVEEQTSAALENIDAIIKQTTKGKGGLDNVIDVTVFLTNLGADYAGMNKIWVKAWPNREGAPARTCVGVKELPSPNLLVELKATALIGDN